MTREHFIVHYKNKTYDISQFKHKHPGGLNTLKGLNDMDMSARFDKAPPHSDAAMYLMKEYEIEWKKVKASKSHANDDNNNSKNVVDKNVDLMNNSIPTTKIDERMEHLVDWTQPMIPQICTLKHNYTEWVNLPVDRPLRLFGPNWLEMLTKTPWWVVPTFWIPTIVFILKNGIENALQEHNSSKIDIGVNFVGGIFLWTIVEYLLHRFVFHLNASNGGAFLCTFHFLLHGLHHKVPFDPLRLVFPPFPAVILATIFYQPVKVLFKTPCIVISGGLFGYLCYDMIHYYIHYGSPSLGYLYNLKRYHYQHHFVHHDKGFGISSPLWDLAFGTKIFLRKLKYLLKW